MAAAAATSAVLGQWVDLEHASWEVDDDDLGALVSGINVSWDDNNLIFNLLRSSTTLVVLGILKQSHTGDSDTACKAC
jgi:hypothetical protein